MAVAVVFDVQSLLKIGLYEPDTRWFGSFSRLDIQHVKRVEIDQLVYFVSDTNKLESSPIIVINTTTEFSVLRSDDIAPHTFSRIVTVAQSIYTNSVSVPSNWHIHHQASLASVYAGNKTVAGMSRIYYDSSPAGTRDLFVFLKSNEVITFDLLPRFDDTYLIARANLGRVLAFEPTKAERSKIRITLGARPSDEIVPGASLTEIYNIKLTEAQRRFVDMPYLGPVRLRGAAGTGKTLSLVIKFLRDGSYFEIKRRKVRFCFLTHSSGTVASVNRMCSMLDPSGLTLGLGQFVDIEIRTLYDLSADYLRFDLNHLVPLSLDGREGRLLQAELIHSVLGDLLSNKLARSRWGDISQPLLDGWHNHQDEHNRFVSDIMNEFASVLDADGVWSNTEKGEKYAKGTLGYRPVYLMTLPTERDRRFILEVHKQYRLLLSAMKTLSVDQMVADFNSFLNGNTWDRAKSEKGFDAVFVDELHLFSAIEREILHKLIRYTQILRIEHETPEGESKDVELARPSVFMAYDIKQSPRDSFTQLGPSDTALFSAVSQLQKADLIKLSTVFRYTPQIADFLADIDAAFPAMNMGDDWEAITAESEVADGEKPTMSIFREQRELVRQLLSAAIKDAKRLGPRKVAVLCVNDKLFDQYVKIVDGRYKGEFIVIDSREAAPDFRHAGKRPVLSMPEFVAGLQFQLVYLLNVDARFSS